MRVFKKALAVVCSALVVTASVLPVMAADPETTAGTGNVLAYSLESVIVPTSLSVALNPQGYTVTKRAAVEGGAAAVTTTDQIVSVDYGIANLSTAAKVVSVSFGITATTDDEKTPITFVATEAEAEAKSSENTNGAETGELKMYLAIAAAKTAPTTAAGDAFAVTEVADGANTHNVTAANLTDLTMTKATASNVAFAAADGKLAAAEIAFALPKATYSIIEGQTIDFSTTQETLKTKVQVAKNGLGGITGFTFVGKMNENADWTTANASALTFTPVYDIDDADGSEETLDDTHLQIEATPAVVSRVSANSVSSSSSSVTVTLPDGVTVSGLVLTKAAGGTVNLTAGTQYNVSGSTYTFTSTFLGNQVGGTITFTFSDSQTATVSVVAGS